MILFLNFCHLISAVRIGSVTEAQLDQGLFFFHELGFENEENIIRCSPYSEAFNKAIREERLTWRTRDCSSMAKWTLLQDLFQRHYRTITDPGNTFANSEVFRALMIQRVPVAWLDDRGKLQGDPQ